MLKATIIFCSVGWDVADHDKTNANTVPLLPCSQASEVHEDSRVRKLPGDISRVQGSLPVYMTAPPFLCPMQENPVSLAFQHSPPMVSLCPLSSFEFIVPRLKPEGKILLY